MAGENVKQYFTKHKEWQVNGNFLCEFCGIKYAKGTTSTRLRAHLTGEPKSGARSCPNVSQLVKDSLPTENNKRPRTMTSSSPSQLNNNFGSQGGQQLGLEFRYDEISQQNIMPFPNVTTFQLGETSEVMLGITTQQIESGGTFQPNTLQTTFSMGMAAESMQPNESGNNLQHEESQTSDFFAGVSLENDSLMDGVHQREVRDEERVQEVLSEERVDMTEETMLPNQSRSNLQPEAFPSADSVAQPVDRDRLQIITRDLENCLFTDEAYPHIARDKEMAQEIPNVEYNQETREPAWTTKRLVGEAFVKNEGKIWSWLMDDQVLRVGIYGMGGVGKTTLMRRIQTRLKRQSSLEVYWVTVSQDFSIWKLQNLIAKTIGFEFIEKEDEVERAEELTQSLKAEGKCVLILDDLWNYFNIDDVGIPVKVNACKLVLTTRLLDVCRQMDCSEVNRIQLQRLSKEEAWILFTQELGDYIPEVEELAKAISGECGGLPLGIKVMARTMKGIRNVHTWRNALEELKEVKSLEMREEVFSVLKFSFLRLKDSALQACLSYCALFPEDERIERNMLIRYMVVEGIIDERSRQAELDKGHTMLDTLENACLLRGGTKYVWMHDLIRDMVIHELRERYNTLVEAELQLKKLPDVEKWTEDLVRVSLMDNEIKVIPYSHTPRCPNLSTLLLCGNYQLKMIADSFFEQFQKLKVLDLSRCHRIEVLPGSISNLVNLTALLLSGNFGLIYVPSLVKLHKLKMLDLRLCFRLKEMPEGVKFLPKLKYLDLFLTGRMEREREISKFVGELRMLETLYCNFHNLKEFEEYIESQKRSEQSLSDYSFYIGHFLKPERPTLKYVSIEKISFSDPLRLPTDIEALSIKYCGSTVYKRLFPPSILPCLINLQEILVHSWNAIEEIFAVKEDNINTALVQFPFSNHSSHSLSGHSLLNLKVIGIWYCNKLKKLFPPSLLPNLHNLQEIKVGYCHVMEEIFSTDQEDGEELSFGQSINNNHYPPNPASTSTVSTGLNLPKLTKLDLCYLRELRSIYKGAINCHSLQEIQLIECPKVERITLPLPQPSLRRIRVAPKEWWESVQWGSANDKIHLQSLVGFRIEDW